MGIPDLNTADWIGNERFKADKRRIAGIWLVISFSVIVFPMARLAPHINRDGETASEGIALAFMIGMLITLAIGIMGATLAFLACVWDYSTPQLTYGFLVFEFLAWIPYLTEIVMIGKQANSGKAFIPEVYAPSEADVWFVGAMGMLGAATFCLFLFGSVAFYGFALYAYQTGDAHSRNGAYYRQRLVTYSIVMVIAGLAQLMLGSYIIKNFGNGPMPGPPIGVAMWVIHFPEINVLVGLIYMLNGFYGVYRGMVKCGAKDQSFQLSLWFQWVCTLILMILTQVAYAPGANAAPAGPTVTALTLGVHVTPAFFDWMGRNVPDDFTDDYYQMHEAGTFYESANKEDISVTVVEA